MEFHLHHNLFFSHEGRWRPTDAFTASFLHFSLFSTALLDLANSRPVHSLMSSSHLFLCLLGVWVYIYIWTRALISLTLFHATICNDEDCNIFGSGVPWFHTCVLGNVAELVEHRTSTTPTQVRFLGAARGFFSQSQLSRCRLSYGVRTPPWAVACIHICAHVKDPVVHVKSSVDHGNT